MTLNELADLCNKLVAEGYGERILLLKDYKLGNTHREVITALKPLEKANTSIIKRHRNKYIELA